jgi:hypothetical protein
MQYRRRGDEKMLENKIDTQMNPRILTDRELADFAERHLNNAGTMPISFQQEVLARLQQRLKTY